MRSESHVAPPVASMSWMETNDTETMPLASLNVARVPATVVSSVMRLPDVPDRENALTVCVVPAVSLTVAGCVVLDISANVLLPATVNAPAPPWTKVPYVSPPPEKVLAVALFMVMVEPDALTVALVDVAIVHAEAPLPKTTTDAPVIVRTRALLFEDENIPVVSVLPFRSSVPLVSVNVLVEPSVRASCACHDPPTPLNVTGKSKATPLVVMVLTPEVAANVVAFVPADMVIPDDTKRFPKIVLAEFTKEPEKPVKSIFFTFPSKVSAYVPVCILKEMEEFSANAPALTLIPARSA